MNTETQKAGALPSRKDERRSWIERVNRLKETGSLPRNWRKRVINRNPVYNSVEGVHRMDNVYSGHVADVALIAIMEEIAKEYANEHSKTVV